MNKLFATFTAAIVAWSSEAAVAFTEQQSKDIDALKGATAAAIVCKSIYVADDIAAYRYLIRAGVDPVNPAVIAQIRDGLDLAIRFLTSDPNKLCPAMWTLYGPGERRTSGLLKRKEQ